MKSTSKRDVIPYLILEEAGKVKPVSKTSKLADLIAFLDAHGPALHFRRTLTGRDGATFVISASWLSRYANDGAISRHVTYSPKYRIPRMQFGTKDRGSCS